MLKEKYLKLKENDLSISFLDNERISNKTLLFVHGWQADKNNLKAIFMHLNDSYRIISIDLPGFGSSSAPKKIIGSIEYASYIKSFLDKLNIKKVCYVGHSIGGKIGIVAAVKYKDLIEKLVLIDSAGIRNHRNFDWYLKVYFYKILKFFISKILRDDNKLKKLKENFGSTDYRKAGVMRDILVHVTNEDFSNYLSQIECPVFLYWGEKDKDTPLWMAKKMKRKIKDSALYIVKNSGHFSFLNDDRIVRIIQSFY